MKFFLLVTLFLLGILGLQLPQIQPSSCQSEPFPIQFDYPQSIVFHPSDNLIAVIHDYGYKVSVVDLEQSQIITSMEIEDRVSNGGIFVAAFSPDGNILAGGGVAMSGIAPFHFWDINTGEEIRSLMVRQSGSWIQDLEFSPDGRWLAFITGPNMHISTVHLVNLTDYESTEITTDYGGYVSLVFSPDSKLLVTSGWLPPRKVPYFFAKVWSIQEANEIGTLGNNTQTSDYVVGFLSDTELLTSAVFSFNPPFRVWNIETGEVVREFSAEISYPRNLILDPTRNHIAFSEDNLWGLLNIKTGNIEQSCQAENEIFSIAFSSDGIWVATVEVQGQILFWQIDH